MDKEERKENLKIELAKTFFILSQIFMILSGLLFAAAGVYYASSMDESINAHRIITSDFNSYVGLMPDNCYSVDNLTESYLNLLETGLNMSVDSAMALSLDSLRNVVWWSVYSFLGIITFILSISFYFKGKSELKKILKNYS